MDKSPSCIILETLTHLLPRYDCVCYFFFLNACQFIQIINNNNKNNNSNSNNNYSKDYYLRGIKCSCSCTLSTGIIRIIAAAYPIANEAVITKSLT